MEININDQMQPLNFNNISDEVETGDWNTGAFMDPIDFIRQPDTHLQSMCNVVIFLGKDK